jgi:urease accessory protein
MHANAHIAVTTTPPGVTRIARLHSEPPMALRPVLPTTTALPPGEFAGAAHISVAAGAASPIGGDDLNLQVDICAGATLVLRSVSATLALPGPRQDQSHTTTTIRISAGGTLIWLPEPIIAAHGCDHRSSTHIHLDPTASLLIREELVLGRHNETPGSIQQRLRVNVGDRPVHDQELRIGPRHPGWQSPAVTGGRKTIGSLLGVGREFAPPTSCHHTAIGEIANVDTAIQNLGESATLVTTLAPDALALRRELDRHMYRWGGL